MPKLNEEVLREKARAHCTQAMKDLVRAELRVEPGASSIAWDSFRQRHVFSETFTVWREFDEVEMLVAPDGRILSFRDRNRLAPGGNPPSLPLTKTELLAIAGTTGQVSAGAAIVRTLPKGGNLMDISVYQTEAGFPTSVDYTINLGTRQVAVFTVQEGVDHGPK